MSAIEVDPDEVTDVGNAITGLAGRAAHVATALGGVVAGDPRPPLTGAALDHLTVEWAAGAGRLEGELTALGQAALAAGFLYRRTDESVIGVSPP